MIGGVGEEGLERRGREGEGWAWRGGGASPQLFPLNLYWANWQIKQRPPVNASCIYLHRLREQRYLKSITDTPTSFPSCASHDYLLHIISETISKDAGLEVNADKTKYMVMPRDQNAGRRQNIKIDNSSFERVEEFKYLGNNISNSKFYWRRN